MLKFAVFVSGHGSNLQAIIQALKKGKIKGAALGLVVSDRKDAYALQRAARVGIKAVFINPQEFGDRESFDKAVIQHLKKERVDFIVLAGFMRILSRHFIETYKNKILNVHPSLLPAFKGAHAIKDAFEYGVKVTGVTVHLVDEEVDHGPIIMQEPVLITSRDTLETLEKRIHRLEHRIYPQTINRFVQGKVEIQGGKVRVKREK